MEIHTDAVIVGSGVAGLYSALKLPEDMKVVLITKSDLESSDSFLAQGGICVQRDEEDYDSYFEDTMKAGHYENRRESVDIMIRGSRAVIQDLVGYGVWFEQENGEFIYTREGAHSRPRILFHEDITGKEITSTLLERVKKLANVTIYEYTEMTDIIEENGACAGILAGKADGTDQEQRETLKIYADHTILASGGIGGNYQHSTNYVQIHPTTLYSLKPGRRFLISESVRGEGAVLYNHKKERFVDELLPRDVVAQAIREQMEAEGTDYVWLSMEPIPREKILKHFPNIYRHCLEEGYDVTKEWIPVVPAQHYFMGGIWVDSDSHTSMDRLYAVGETSCNGVHGANRLASNSLLESLVFAGRAAEKIKEDKESGLI